MINFEKTNMLLEITLHDSCVDTYYTYEAPCTVTANYFHVIDRKDYYVQGLNSGNIIRYFKNENRAELIDTVTGEVKTLTNRKYRIYQDN